jgi:hypothetical protein
MGWDGMGRVTMARQMPLPTDNTRPAQLTTHRSRSSRCGWHRPSTTRSCARPLPAKRPPSSGATAVSRPRRQSHRRRRPGSRRGARYCLSRSRRRRSRSSSPAARRPRPRGNRRGCRCQLVGASAGTSTGGLTTRTSTPGRHSGSDPPPPPPQWHRNPATAAAGSSRAAAAAVVVVVEEEEGASLD